MITSRNFYDAWIDLIVNRDSIIVRVLHWNNPEYFTKKLKDADDIEGYNPNPSQPSTSTSGAEDLYTRRTVNVEIISTPSTTSTSSPAQSHQLAYMYVATSKAITNINTQIPPWTPIESGDWMKRTTTST